MLHYICFNPKKFAKSYNILILKKLHFYADMKICNVKYIQFKRYLLYRISYWYPFNCSQMYESLKKTEITDKRNICDKQMIDKNPKGKIHGIYLLNILFELFIHLHLYLFK